MKNSESGPRTSHPASSNTARRAQRATVSLRTAGVALLATGAVMALSACGAASSPSSSSAQASTSGSSSSASQSSSASASSTASATATSSSAAAQPGICTAAMLSGEATSPQGSGAGQTYFNLTVTNTSSAPCILDGYPGVSLVGNGNGTQQGAPADRDASLPSSGPITLAPAAKATARLQYSQAGNYQGCTVVQADGIRVYPPSATDALYIAHPLNACSETGIVLMHIGAFAAG